MWEPDARAPLAMKHGYQRILVVDGCPGLPRSVADVLRSEGLSVLAVRDSDQALQALDGRFGPDAILINLPAGDHKAAEFLLCARSNHGIPIISTSTSTPPALRRIGPGADWELQKPFDLAELLSVLDRLCGAPRPPVDRGG